MVKVDYTSSGSGILPNLPPGFGGSPEQAQGIAAAAREAAAAKEAAAAEAAAKAAAAAVIPAKELEMITNYVLNLKIRGLVREHDPTKGRLDTSKIELTQAELAPYLELMAERDMRTLFMNTLQAYQNMIRTTPLTMSDVILSLMELLQTVQDLTAAKAMLINKLTERARMSTEMRVNIPILTRGMGLILRGDEQNQNRVVGVLNQNLQAGGEGIRAQEGQIQDQLRGANTGLQQCQNFEKNITEFVNSFFELIKRMSSVINR